MIRPKKVEDAIEIKRNDGTTTKLYKPEPTVDQEQVAAVEGEIVAVSPLAFTYEDWGSHEMPKVGDRVYYAKYSGMIVKGVDGVEYRLTKDKDIAAVIA